MSVPRLVSWCHLASPGSLAVQSCFAGARVHGHPVADGGQVGARGGGVEEAAGALGGHLAERGVEFVGVLVLERDARGHEAAGGMGSEMAGEEIVPAEGGESHGDFRFEILDFRF